MYVWFASSASYRCSCTCTLIVFVPTIYMYMYMYTSACIVHVRVCTYTVLSVHVHIHSCTYMYCLHVCICTVYVFLYCNIGTKELLLKSAQSGFTILCAMLYSGYLSNADTIGTHLKCPDYLGVLYSWVGTFYHYNESMAL